jgi:D-3-phosphoglycerate dehydrogenase
MGTELSGHTLGVIGLGKIGQRVAKVAYAAGMKILAYDPFISKEKAEDMGYRKVELEEIFRLSDFITLHVPKTKETLNMINKTTIAIMKTGVRIVNCARGGLINETDLAEAIKSGKVAGAAIDVFDKEPCENSALHDCGDKVILTPHLGASTSQAQLNVALDVAEQIRDVLKGGVARAAVNLPGLKPELVAQIKHYLGLAEIMGSFLGQITDGAIRAIEIEALGKLADKNIEGLKLAILKGILGVSLDGVTFVNAPLLATERNIKVSEIKSEDSGAYIDKLRIKHDQEIKRMYAKIKELNLKNYSINLPNELVETNQFNA